MIETLATVESNDELSPGYRLMVLGFDQKIETGAGQFAMVRAEGLFEPLLRRALAVYRQLGSHRLSFLYQILGRGTRVLSQCVAGSKVEALIPLGNSWPVYSRVLPDDPTGALLAESQPKKAVVVAGGIGSASLLMLCEQLVREGIETHVLFGAASRAAATGCGLEDFSALGLPLTITTDDGSLGERGFVTNPLERLLSSEEFGQAVIYACGPWVMMSRVAGIAAESEVRCFVSLEAPMGCGFGVCVGCVVAVQTDGPTSYESYKRVCTEGSIFPADIIEWKVNAMTHS